MVFPDAGTGGDSQEQTLSVKIAVDAQEAIKNLAEFLEAVNRVKAEMRSLKEISGASLRDVAKSMESTISNVPEGFTAKDVLSSARSQLIQEEREISKARQDEARRSIEAERSRVQETIRLNQQAVANVRENERQIAAERRMRIAEDKRSQQEWADFVKQKDADQVRSARDAAQARLKEVQQQIALRKELDSGSRTGFLGFLQNLGTVGQFVFGTVLGMSAMTVMRSLIRFFIDATEAGFEFAKALFQLEVGVRALQRAGMDITLRQMYDQLRDLKREFGIFAFTDLVKGASQFTNLIRDLGFTRDQFFELQTAVATLATVNGRAMDEVQKTVALALSSGYTEGLQRLGVSINRVTIAQEAANMGWRGGYTSLTEVQRAAATYNLIIEKTAIYQEDLYKYQNTAPGEIDRLTAAWKDLKAEMGAGVIPILGAFAGALADIIDFGERIPPIIQDNIKAFLTLLSVINPLINPLKTLSFLLAGLDNVFTGLNDAIKNKTKFTIKDFIESWRQAFIEIGDLTGGSTILGDTQVTNASQAQKELDKITTAVANNIEDIEKVVEDGADRRRELEEKLTQDLEEIQRDSLRRRAELEREYQRDIEDINRDASRDVAAAQRSYANDLTKLSYDTARKEDELREKQRQKELDDEKKFQEKMRKLRADFLFDLEEAVRARDAVQIRRLQRRYDFQRNELINEREQERKDSRADFERELNELRRQAAEKRRELAIAFQQKLADIEQQRQYELQDAALKHQQDLEDLRRQEAEKREERLLAYRQELEDLNRQQNDRLRKVAEALAQEINITGQGAQKVYEVLKAYFGPGGAIDQLYQYYIQSSQNAASAASNALSSTTPTGTPKPKKTWWGGSYANGGSFVADRPTTARFGENMPELVTATPLNASRNLFSAARQSASGAMGNLSVLIKLSPGLEADIVEKSLSEFDGLLASIERSR